MKKNELISLANEMCKELLTIINAEKETTKEQVVTYLRESAQMIMDLNDTDISDSNFAETLFRNAYKDIANKSLSSYAQTNAQFEKLTQMHEQTLLECNDELINLPSLTNKFDEIQEQMNNEIKKANTIITKLTTQVKTLEIKSNLDALTKVYNRHALTSYLKQICSNHNRSYELYMLMVDIDDFKIINDKYGHLAGDKVLIFIANIFRKTLRDGDKVFRYGGEEFIIILNRTDDVYSEQITSRLLELVRGNKLIYKGESLSVTISIGTTKFSQGDTPDTLVARADKALYRAKENGKNQFFSEIK